jgi:hypothetical protein
MSHREKNLGCGAPQPYQLVERIFKGDGGETEKFVLTPAPTLLHKPPRHQEVAFTLK